MSDRPDNNAPAAPPPEAPAAGTPCHKVKPGQAVLDRSAARMQARLIRSTSPPGFLQLQQAADGWPCFMKIHHTEPGRTYFRAVEGAAHVDDSFAIARGGYGHLLAECNVTGDTLGRFGGPLELRLSPASTFYQMRDDVSAAFGELRTIARLRNATKILLRTTAANDPYGFVASRALAGNATPRVETRAEIDLSLSEDDILNDLRTTHRQQLRWGREHLCLDAVSSSSPERSKLDEYREFHARIAGRVTRSMASWDAMFSWIEGGVGELVAGLQGSELVAGGVSLDAMGTAYYVSGVYDRTRFRHPLSHFLVYSMIIRARRRGMRFFDVGVVYAANDEASDKERAIGRFKHGFTSRTVSSTIWTVPVE